MASSGGTTQRVLSAVIRVNDRFTSPMQRIIRITQRFQSVANRIRPIVARVRDLASPVITRIQSGLRRLADTRVGRFVISAVDKVTQVLNPVVSRVRNFVSGHYQAVLSAIDKATKVISSVLGKAKAFAGKMYSATVSVKDKASSILGSLKGKLAALAGGVTIGVALKTGIEGLGEEQTQKITINRVFENAGGTKKQAQKQTQEYYKYLEEYANKTPFSTSEMTQFGTKSAMMAKGDMGMAKQLTDAQANVKAIVGELKLPTCYSNVA